jgi:hypothetical protein
MSERFPGRQNPEAVGELVAEHSAENGGLAPDVEDPTELPNQEKDSLIKE